MTDLEALHRAILGHPDDDTPRLIYADALDEAGEGDRAAFIRLQVAADRVPDYDPIAVRFRYQELKDLGGWPLETLPELPPGLAWTEQPFHRGFPSAIEAGDGSAFVEHAEALFAIAPVEELHLTAIPLTVSEGLSACSRLARVSALVLADGVNRMTAVELLRSPHLARLASLQLGSGLTTPAAVQAVVRSPAFARLHSFGCRDDSWSAAAVNELARLAAPPPIHKLDLSSNRLTDQHLMRLVESPLMRSVEDLALNDNNLGPEGVSVLAAARLPKLRSLQLIRVRPEDSGIEALMDLGIARELRSLTLSGNFLGPRTAVTIAGSEWIANLRVLDLSENRIGDIGAVALARSPNLDNVLHLDLRDNEVGSVSRQDLRDRFGERVVF
jgi:uncharacterized protein (TIGR02996 family)